MSKLEIIPGDLAQPECGISKEDQNRLLPEVQYIIHAAANIQFDNPIQTDLNLSYVATKTIADLAAKVGIPQPNPCKLLKCQNTESLGKFDPFCINP